MNILVVRNRFTLLSSLGNISISNDNYRAFSVEDVARAEGVKIPKETAIQAGVYPVIMDWSNRHQSIQPHILNVPMFEGIRFDVANYARQLEGCIGVGFGRGQDAVWNSAKAHAVLCEKIDAAINRGELVWVDIQNRQERI